MKCDLICERLSPFIDGELGSDEQLQIQQHVDGCANCGLQVAQFLAIGNLMRQSESLVDTDAVWEQLQGRLDQRPTAAARSSDNRLKWGYAILSTAASFVLLWFLVSNTRNRDHGGHGVAEKSHAHAALAVDFQEVFRSAQTEPKAAIAELVAKYQGQELDHARTVAYLGYEPAPFRSLPAGVKRTSTHVLNMPCCKCSATICERDDGTSLIVFEHKEEQPFWFGDASSIETQCAGRTCKIVESAGQLAVSWKNQDRQLTIIGANDVSEIDDWVATMMLN